MLEEGGLSSDDESNLEKIYSAGDTLLSLVNDILDISKIEAGRFELSNTEYDLPSLINDTITHNILRIGDKPIEFLLNINEDLPAVMYGDDLRIKQVLSNLLSNAFKYTRQGTVELGMDFTREGEVIWLTAWVKDTGMGIREEDLAMLFSEYSQVDIKSNREIEGTGLGLPITKMIVGLMDGSISVESEYGQGSTFTIRIKQKHVNDLTIGSEVVKSLQSFRYSNHRRTRNAKRWRIRLPYARVLVVDDNATNLDVARGLMKPYGMQIDTVTSGQQAIDVMCLDEVRYDAIFMDHMMPGMDGIEATQRIRELGSEYAQHIPVIALTANAIAGSEKMFLDRGFQDFLSKPIDLSRLDSVIRQWVRRKSMEVDEDQAEYTENLAEENAAQSSLLSYQTDAIDLRAGLGLFSGDSEAYIQVLRSYASNTRSLLGSLDNINSDNLPSYAITVHGIKGSSRSICAYSLGDKAEALEKAAKEGNLDFALANTPELVADTLSLLNYLDIMIRELTSDSSKETKAKPDRVLLEKIIEACRDFDMQTVESAVKEMEGFNYENHAEIIPWLWENVQQFNIDDIVKLLNDLLQSEDYQPQ